MRAVTEEDEEGAGHRTLFLRLGAAPADVPGTGGCGIKPGRLRIAGSVDGIEPDYI